MNIGKDILKIIAGNILITLAYAFITVPNEIVNGGVTSFSMILESVFSLDIRIIVNIVTVSLLIVCLIFLGKEVFAKSIISSLCYMIFFNVFYSFKFIFNFNIYLSIILAAILVGIGYYLCISANSSTVGFDIIALILNKRNNEINIAKAMRYINIIIIMFGLINYGVYSIIIGIIFTIIQTNVLGLLLKRKIA